LRRSGFAAGDIAAIRRAYKLLYRSKLSLEHARTRIAAEAETVTALRTLVEFLEAPGRGIIR
jgi:UDP-N-acetylglucosamine acyltransferase